MRNELRSDTGKTSSSKNGSNAICTRSYTKNCSNNARHYHNESKELSTPNTIVIATDVDFLGSIFGIVIALHLLMSKPSLFFSHYEDALRSVRYKLLVGSKRSWIWNWTTPRSCSGRKNGLRRSDNRRMLTHSKKPLSKLNFKPPNSTIKIRSDIMPILNQYIFRRWI